MSAVQSAPSQAGPPVVSVVADGVATLTLDRPDRANALSSAMIAALHDAILTAQADPGVRVIVIAANGRIFSAGHDLAEMRSMPDKAGLEALFTRCADMMRAIRACPKPVIARVQGAAVAAGCQLVATCDLAYAAETAKFGVNGINLGLFCATPSVALSRAVQPRQALDLLLTGRLITAARAAELGLVNAAVPMADLDATVAETAALIAAKLPDAIGLGKDLFWRQQGLDLADAYALAGERMAENMGFTETGVLVDHFIKR
jgi:enoyl-CoA hydratase/carnithine racemase